VGASTQQAAELHGGALGGSLPAVIAVVAVLAVVFVKARENEVLDQG